MTGAFDASILKYTSRSTARFGDRWGLNQARVGRARSVVARIDDPDEGPRVDHAPVSPFAVNEITIESTPSSRC